MYSPMQDAAVRMGEQVYAAWAALRLGLLLGDAVDVAAAEGDLPRLHTHDLGGRGTSCCTCCDGELRRFRRRTAAG